MSLRAALDRIVVLQQAVSITSPVTLTIKKAYKLVPPQNEQLPDLPAVINKATYLGQEAGAGMRTLRYRVEMQCAAARATVEDDRSADIALALWEKMLDDFSHDLKLNGNVTLALFEEGSSEIPVRLELGGQTYIGFNAVLNIQITEAFTFT